MPLRIVSKLVIGVLLCSALALLTASCVSTKVLPTGSEPAHSNLPLLLLGMAALPAASSVGFRRTHRESDEADHTARETTEHHLPEAPINEMRALLLSMLEATSDLVALSDQNGRVCYLNQAGRKMLGIDADLPLIGEDVTSERLQSEELSLLDDLFPIGIREEVWRGEQMLRARDGRRIPVSQVVIVHRDSEGKIVYLSTMAREMTDRKELDEQIQQQLALIQAYSHELEAQKAALEQANARLEVLATTDELTGLKNRRTSRERLAEEFQRSKRYGGSLSVMMLDIDHFKLFNDAFGHPAGDQVIRKVADLLLHNARATDIVARYGGEEFIIVLPETEAQSALEAAERIRAAIASRDWEQRPITVSIGVASLQPTTENQMALIDEADQALYRSKAHGRNQVTHSSDLRCAS